MAFEGGVPTNSTLSKNGELVPKVFNDLRLGEHFTLQSILGYSTLVGPGEDGGLQTFEYGFVFGEPKPEQEKSASMFSYATEKRARLRLVAL